MKPLFAALALLALAACASPPTVYGPAATINDIGYRQQQIESDRFRVSFRANADKRPPLVEDLAMRRAAEIARDNGAQWFRVVNRSTELVSGDRGGGTSLGVGGSSGSYGSSVGVGIGLDLSPDSRRYETTLEILLGRGVRPSDGNVYDVQSTLSRTGG